MNHLLCQKFRLHEKELVIEPETKEQYQNKEPRMVLKPGTKNHGTRCPGVYIGNQL